MIVRQNTKQHNQHRQLSMINKVRHSLEKYGFGVCQYIGKKIGVPSSIIRKYFIYTSFIGVGSPLIIYLFAAFWLNIRTYVQRQRDILFD